MFSHRNLITTEPCGVQTGTAFDDISLIQAHNDIVLTSIVVYHGDFINSLIVSMIPVLRVELS